MWIILQMRCGGFDATGAQGAIDPADVDGVHPNLGLYRQAAGAGAVHAQSARAGRGLGAELRGAEVVVVGRSVIVGRQR